MTYESKSYFLSLHCLFKTNNNFIYFCLCWVFIITCGLSPVAVSGGCSLVLDAVASLVEEDGLQDSGLQLWWCVASTVAAPRL